MKVVVTDASALVEYLLRTERSGPVDRAVADPDADLHVPALCDVEVVAALRRALLTHTLNEPRAREALSDYEALPVTRHGHQDVLHRALDLRHNFSAYDAVYVALAEGLKAELVTADDALASASRKYLRPR
ncbi:MAG TPA: type II toxin-antitoxin system VapC family toxin [Gemmatimonadales bacterium]